MFSRKRKRGHADTLAHQSEQISLFFARIKDDCGYSCVPTIQVDVRNEDVVLAVSGIEQLSFQTLNRLCESFQTVSDVYCDLNGKTTYVTVERTKSDLLDKHKRLIEKPSETEQIVTHPETSTFIKSVAKQDAKVLSDTISVLKETFNVGSFTKMKLDIINRPGIITVHASNVRKIPAAFILKPCKVMKYVDFERSFLCCNIEKIKKPSNVV